MATLTTGYQLLAETYLGSSYGDLYVRLYGYYSQQDIVNNRSYVIFQARAYFSGNYIRDNQGSGNVSGSLATVSGSCTYPTKGETTIATTEGWVSHASDGTLSVYGAAYLNFPNWRWSGTAAAWATLPSIPRQATLSSAPDFTDDENPTITYSNPAGDAVSSLRACISLTGASDDVPYRDISKSGTSYTFILTDEEKATLRNNTPNSESRTVYFYVRTEIGGNTFYSTLPKTYTVPASVVPTASMELSDPMEYLDTYGKYIQSLSKVKGVITASGAYGSTIKSYNISVDGQNYSEAEFTTELLKCNDLTGDTGTLDVVATITDTRGRSVVINETLNVYRYLRPQILSVTAKRCQEYNVNEIGDDFLGVVFSGKVTSLDEQNVATYELDYKKISETAYTTLDLSDYANQFSVTEGYGIFPADDDAYNIILRITDNFGSFEKKLNGPSISVLISKLKYNLGIAFGKLAELSGVLDIGFKTRFHGGLLRMVLDEETNLDELKTPNTYAGRDIESAGYLNCPEGITGKFVLLVESAGDNGEIYQKLTTCDKMNPLTYERFCIDDEWGNWICRFTELNSKISTTNNALKTLMDVKAKSTDNAPLITDTDSFLWRAASDFPCGSINIPTYTTGIYITNGGSDGILMGVDYLNNFYLGFRNGSTWGCRKI